MSGARPQGGLALGAPLAPRPPSPLPLIPAVPPRPHGFPSSASVAQSPVLQPPPSPVPVPAEKSLKKVAEKFGQSGRNA